MDTPRRHRAKISITLDPTLLRAVDQYVQDRADMDRSKVMETALQDWYRARQDEAMVEQFTGPDTTDASELRSWRKIRRAAVGRKLKPPAR
jgi:hypothetical protein